MKLEIEIFIAGIMLGAALFLLVFMAQTYSINNECEKELLRRDEPKGIVCLTKIQSIVINEGDDRNE